MGFEDLVTKEYLDNCLEELTEALLAALQSKEDQKEVLTTKECAELLGYTTSYVNHLAREGELPYIKVGKRRMFKRTELLKVMAKQRLRAS